MKVPFVRSAYNYDVEAVSNETGIDCSGPGAQQQFKEECDINTIVKRFGLTGEMPTSLAMPRQGDFTAAVSFHEAMNMVKLAESEFMRLPAAMRGRFGNDPGALIGFLEDPANRKEAEALGLIPKPPEKPRELAAPPDAA